MKIILLTHERELHRATNTGNLAIENTNNIVERIVWERVNPSKVITQLIENNEAALLYSKATPVTDVTLTILFKSCAAFYFENSNKLFIQT